MTMLDGSPTPLVAGTYSQGGSRTRLDAPWHPVITLAMAQGYDPSIDALTACVVLPDGWTGPAPGPPTGTGVLLPAGGAIVVQSLEVC